MSINNLQAVKDAVDLYNKATDLFNHRLYYNAASIIFNAIDNYNSMNPDKYCVCRYIVILFRLGALSKKSKINKEYINVSLFEKYINALNVNNYTDVILFYRGFCSRVKKDNDTAIKIFNEAIDLIKNNETSEGELLDIIYNALGATQMVDRKYNDAMNSFNNSITNLDNKRNFPNPYNNLGDAYTILRMYSKAEEEYKRAINAAEEWAEPHDGLGNLFKQANEKNDEKAIGQYNMAIKKSNAAYLKHGRESSDWAQPYHKLGDIYYEQKKYIDANRMYKNAIKRYKKNECEKEYKFYLSEIIKKQDFIKKVSKIKGEKFNDINDRIIHEVVINTREYDSEIVRKKKKQSAFYYHGYHLESEHEFTFEVLRKWNSFTPIINSSSKGGGYFIKYKPIIKNESSIKNELEPIGIVIDPGFDFIDNFIEAGHHFKEIDYVMITHAHNDHTADIESILNVLTKYNDNLKGSKDDIIAGSIRAHTMKYENISIGKNIDDELEKIIEQKFNEERKKITFYFTRSVYAKYAGFFELKDKTHYRIKIVDSELANEIQFQNKKEIINNLSVSVIKAKHNDVVSDDTSVGFCFKINNFALICTGDTGFFDDNETGCSGIKESYEKLQDELKERKINNVILVANIGGFQNSEENYLPESEENEKKEREKYYYKNHLGRIEIAHLVNIIEPKVCIISEFGEEYNNFRKNIADVFTNAFNKTNYKTIFIPADIGLKITSDLNVNVVSEMDENNNIKNYKYVEYKMVDTNEKNGKIDYFLKDEFDKNAIEDCMNKN